MTMSEAMAEAQKRWGKRAFISFHNGSYLVGTESDSGSVNDATGTSKESWEAAFANADKWKGTR